MKKVETEQARQEIENPVVSYIKLDALKKLIAKAETDGAESVYIAHDHGDPNERIWVSWAYRDRTVHERKERWFLLDIRDGFVIFRIDKYE